MADHDSKVHPAGSNVPVEQLASVGERVLRKEGSNSRESNARKRRRRSGAERRPPTPDPDEVFEQDIDDDHVDYRA